MKLKAALKFMLISACCATTFQVLVLSFASFIMRDSAEVIYLRDIYIFPLVGFLSALPVLLFVRRESAPRWEWNVRRVLHLLFTMGLVFGTLLYFEVLPPENIGVALGFFLVLYTILFIIGGIRAKKLADQINERISASYDGEDASH